MKIGSARNLMMFNFTGLSFLAHVGERPRLAIANTIPAP
jgi:hypothetical protein